MKKLSIIVPCYNEEGNIKLFFETAVKSLKKEKYISEFIFINDGSKDNTLNNLIELTKSTEIVKIINFSRNFGKESAIYAGLKKCTGDYAVLIDADMQQHPKLILPMLREIEKDSDIDIVAYYQEKRKENKFVSLLKTMFYKIINKVSDVEFKSDASDFRLFNRNVLNTILSFEEQNRFQKGIFAYIGYNTKYLPYIPESRHAGKTNWNIKSLIKYAFNGIMSYSNYLITLPTKIGFFELLIAIIWFLVLLFNKAAIQNYIIVLFITLISMLQISVGLIGDYVYRTYQETKKRPHYIIKGIISNE